MNAARRHLLRTTFESVIPLPRSFGLAFYERLFALDPRLRDLFSSQPERQATMLVNSLTLAVLDLVAQERASRAVRDLGERHRAYGVRDDDYATFGLALEESLAELLGERFSLEFRDAWREAWTTIVAAMTAVPD